MQAALGKMAAGSVGQLLIPFPQSKHQPYHLCRPLEPRSWGQMSGKDLQVFAKAAVDDGLTDPELHFMASMGKGGHHHRALVNKYLKGQEVVQSWPHFKEVLCGQ